MAINTADTDNNKVPDVVDNLKLGSTQEQFLTITKEALVNLYQKNASQDDTVAEIEKDITDLQIALQGKTKSVTYKNLDALVDKTNGLPKLSNTDLKRGDSVFILDTNSPDFWVSEVATTADNDYDIETKISELQNIGDEATVQVGWFILGKLETQKVDIEGVIKSEDAIGQNELLIGVGSDDTNNESYNVKGIKLGDKLTISEDGTTLNAIDTTYDVATPNANGLMSANDKTKLNKFTEDTNGNLLYNNKEVGKVKSVSINGGTAKEPDNEGNIDLDLSDLSVDVEDLKAEIKDATLINYPSDNDIQYKAIRLNKTSVAIEVLNSNYEAIITQPIVVGDYIYYLLDKDVTGTFHYREVGGNAVGGSGGSSTSNIYFYEHTVRVKITGFSVQFENQTWNASEAYVVFKYFSTERNISVNWGTILATAPFVSGTISYPCSVQGYLKLVLVTTDNGNTVTTTLPSPILQAYILNENILVLDCYVNSATTFEEKILNLSPTGVDGSIQATFTVEDHICYRYIINE